MIQTNESPQIYSPLIVLPDDISITPDPRQEMAAPTKMVKDNPIHSFAIDAYYHCYSIVYQYLLVQNGLLPKTSFCPSKSY